MHARCAGWVRGTCWAALPAPPPPRSRCSGCSRESGQGKAEVPRRCAPLANPPFVKVEATKFTEVGYVGKDVESIIRDLADVAYKLTREQAVKRVRTQAEDRAEDRILDALLPRRQAAADWSHDAQAAAPAIDSDTRQKLRKQLREGALDEREIELDFA